MRDDLPEKLLLTSKETAHLLSISERTLEAWRFSDKGPPWIKLTGIGRGVRYPIDKLKTWMARDGKMTDERTLRGVNLLAYVARKNSTITYKEVADILGGMVARGVGQFLTAELAPYCDANRLPPLWALVVNAGTGKPSEPTVKLPDDQNACYAFDWDGYAVGIV